MCQVAGVGENDLKFLADTDGVELLLGSCDHRLKGPKSDEVPASANGTVLVGDVWSGTLQAPGDVDLFRLHVGGDTQLTSLLVHLALPPEFPATGAVTVGTVKEHGVGSRYVPASAFCLICSNPRST